MEKENVILFQKSYDGAPVYDSYNRFKIACTSFPMPKRTAKELDFNDWHDQDGEDGFTPDIIPIKSYDMEIGLSYKGELDVCYTNISTFLNYLDGIDGTKALLKIYSVFNGFGRQNVTYKDCSDFEFVKDNEGEHLQFKITLHVADPRTEIRPVYSTDGVTVSSLYKI